MTITRRLVDKIAICTSRISSNNYMSVSSKDVEAVDVEPGEEVRVMIIRTDLDGDIKPRDRAVYDTTLQKSKQVYVPADVRNKLDLTTGDLVKYIIIPKDAFPGAFNGPVRAALQKFLGSESKIGDTDTSPESEEERGERQTATAEFEAPMQKTGQITVPSDVRDKMALIKGDEVLVQIEWMGEEYFVGELDIGTGYRITIPKGKREEIGLEPGDEPSIKLGV